MAENSQALSLNLAQARQELQHAQARVAELEADLGLDPDMDAIGVHARNITARTLVEETLHRNSQQEEERQQAEAAVKRYAQRMEILHSIDTGIINATSIETVVEVALRHIRQIIPCQRAAVILFDLPAEEWLIFADDANQPSLPRAVRNPIPSGWDEGFGQAQTRIIDDLRLLQPPMPVYKQLIQEGLVSAIQARLLVQGQTLGFLGLNADTPGFFTAEHQEIATEVANQLAIAIQQMNLSEEIIRHSAELELHVAEIQRMNAALCRSEALFRATFEQAAVGIAHLDRTGRWLQVNQRLCDIVGYTVEELLRKTFQAITHPADLADDMHATQQLLQGEIPFYAMHKRYFHKNGHIVWVNLTVSLVRDAQGGPDYFVAVIEDITPLKQTEQALIQSEDRYRRVVEDQVDLIGRFQSDFKLTFVNRAYADAFGKPPDKMIGQSILDLMPQEYQAGVIAHLSAMNAARPIATSENPLRLADGTLRWFQWTNQIMLDDAGYTLEYQAVGRDITDQKIFQAEQQRHARAVEEMRQFLESTLDAFSSSTAVLASDGTIIKINAAWQHFWDQNGAQSLHNDLAKNYLTVCDNAYGEKSAEAAPTAAGIRAVIEGQQDDFYLEYPCHSPTEQRWFGLRVTPFAEAAPRRVVATHINITERVQIEQTEREQRRFAEALSDSLAALTTALDVKTVLQRILDYAVTVVACDAGSIILFEGDYGRVAYLHGFAPEAIVTLTNYQFPIESATYGNMRIDRKPYFVADTQAVQDWILVPFTEWIRASIGIPIELYGKVIGVLSVDSATPHHFQPTDTEKLQAFARYASLALENAYHVAELEQRVTERTAELQAAKERGEGILNNSLDGILLVDTDLRIQQTNTAFKTLIAYPQNDDFAGSLRDLIHLEDMQRVNALVQTVVKEQGGQQIEICCYRKNGTLFDAELSIGYIKVDSLVLTLRDITERKRAQNTLAEERNLLRTLIDTLPDYIYVKDTHHRTVLCNTAGARAVGTTAEAMIGTDDYAFFPAEMARQFQAHEAQLFQTGLPLIDYEAHAQGPVGNLVWTSTTKVPLHNLDGELIGLVGVTRDISDYKERERQLRFHANLQATVMDAVITTDLAFRIQGWNRAAETIYGWRAEEVIGKSVSEVLQTQFALEATNRQVQQDFLEKGQWAGEVVQRHKDGSVIHILGSTVLFKDEQGIPFGVVSVNHDITARKQSAAALEEQRTFLRQVIDVSPSMIFVKDYDGRFVLVNPIVAQMYNTTVEALLGKSDADFNPAVQEVEAFLAADRWVIESGEPLFVEEPVTSSSGETHWLQTTKVPIISADGKSKYVLGVATDITTRKKAEEALRQNEELLRTVLENLPVGVWIIDPKRKIIQSNPAGQQIWAGVKHTASEAYNEYHAWWADTGQRLTASEWASARAISKGETVLNQELEVEAFDGTHKYILNSAIPILDSQQIIQGAILVKQDITERKQNEKMIRQALAKEKELNELKSRFVSMASHEFRTPLASILALTETLHAYRHRLTDDQIEQRLGKIQEQVGHLKDIMEDVLQLARLQARRTEFNPTLFNLDDLCRSILEEFQSQSDVTHQLLYTCNDALRAVKLDKKLMRQIINNLVSNAIKYSSATTPVMIKLAYTSEMLVLTVRDEGIGILATDLNHLFEPFHRGVNAGTISGTGLGLVIAKEAVELHSGTITVESQPGVVTIFTVSLPVVP